MNRLFIFIVLGVLAVTAPLRGQISLVRVPISTSDEIDRLVKLGVDLSDVPCHHGWDVVTDEADRQRLTEAGFEWEVVIEDMPARYQERFGGRTAMGVYHTYEELVVKLDSLSLLFPEILQVQSIGTSTEGNPIWAVKVSDNPALEEETEPEILLIGNLHAREVVTTEIVLHMIDDLTSRYGVDSTATAYVNQLEFWFVPMANPDGHLRVESGQSWWRKNTRDNNHNGNFHEMYTDGVDLNRNFGYMWGYDNYGSSPSSSSQTYRGPAAFSEPETEAIRQLCLAHNFSFSLSYHSYGRMLLYGWGYRDANTPDHPIFYEWANRMRAYNGYRQGNPYNGLVYNTNGDTDDWFYGEDQEKNRFFGITPETADEFWPPEWQVPIICAENLPSLYVTAEAALQIQENPYHLFVPPQPELTSTQTVDSLILSWSIPEDSDNPPVEFVVEEIQDYRVTVDSAETLNNWIASGFTVSEERSHSGSTAFYSGHGTRQTLTSKLPVLINSDDVLQFWTYYQIYPNNDWAYVEISTDGGASYQSLAGTITTNSYNWRNNRGNGITGSSDWQLVEFPLATYAGQEVYLRFVFNGAWGETQYEGWYIDDISICGTASQVTEVWRGFASGYLALPHHFDPTARYRLRAVDAQGQVGGWSHMVLPRIDAIIIDVDGDGEITLQDVNVLLDEWGYDIPYLDYNQNGKIDIQDVQQWVHTMVEWHY